VNLPDDKYGLLLVVGANNNANPTGGSTKNWFNKWHREDGRMDSIPLSIQTGTVQYARIMTVLFSRPLFDLRSLGKTSSFVSADKVFRAQQIRNYLGNGNNKAPPFEKPKTVREASKKATHFYSMLQTEDGHWAGDYGGPHFLMPGIITAWYLMGRPDRMLNGDQVELMKHYVRVHQQSDGGWGTHVESPSTMFGTTLMYVAIRLLGAEPENDVCVRGRAFLQKHGGAVMTSSWAKFYLCLLGCMEWDGHNSVPPEMWLLPNWFPFHPGRLWCHCRMVYLPMGYLYGSRFVYEKAETDPTIQSLRKEVRRGD
jgi:hypothetical protein